MTDGGPVRDAVRERRARLAKLASVGQSVGYALIAVSVVVFVAGAAAGFTPLTTSLVTAALAGATLTLAPAIVLGYAVKAAEREDRGPGGQGSGTGSRASSADRCAGGGGDGPGPPGG